MIACPEDRRFGWFTALCLCAVIAGVFAVMSVRAASSRSLSYVRSSIGLDTPALDGGDTELEFGDVDGDGNVDLVSVGDHGNPLIGTDQEGIMVWFGDGSGRWAQQQYGDLGYGGIALGDVNGDGLMDVAYGIHHNYASTDLGDQVLEVALGDGSGVFWTPWDDRLARQGQSWGMFATDLGDVDGDGDLDVGSTGFGSSDGFHVYLNSGDGSWRRSFGFLGGNSDHIFQFGDINGDGHLDIATSKQEGTVWLGDGEGFFTVTDGNLPTIGTFATRPGPSLGDVDGDGHDDLAYCDDAGNPVVWLRRGKDLWEDVSAGIPAIGTCEFTQLYDMDSDGLADLSVFGSRTVYVFGGDGSGATWNQLATFDTPDSPGTGKAFRVGGDVDHNGRPDMAMVAEKELGFLNDVNILHAYREGTPPAVLTARIVSPGPYRRLHAGSVAFIDWGSEVPAGQDSTVDLALSTSGPGGPWEPIAAALPNNGRYQWRVPLRLSEDCRIKITVKASGDQTEGISADPFTIARRPDPLELTFMDRDTLTWTDDLNRERYHVYRSDWQRFLDSGEYTQDPATIPQAEIFCDLESPTLVDPFTPNPGTLVFYLVTGYRMMEDGQASGVPVAMSEGTLGQLSDASTRGSTHSCFD